MISICTLIIIIIFIIFIIISIQYLLLEQTNLPPHLKPETGVGNTSQRKWTYLYVYNRYLLHGSHQK